MKDDDPTGQLDSSDELDTILHDFAVSLHEYANGQANGLVYPQELEKAKAAILKLITAAQNQLIDSLAAKGCPKDVENIYNKGSNPRSYWVAKAINETNEEWRSHITSKRREG